MFKCLVNIIVKDGWPRCALILKGGISTVVCKVHPKGNSIIVAIIILPICLSKQKFDDLYSNIPVNLCYIYDHPTNCWLFNSFQTMVNKSDSQGSPKRQLNYCGHNNSSFPNIVEWFISMIILQIVDLNPFS